MPDWTPEQQALIDAGFTVPGTATAVYPWPPPPIIKQLQPLPPGPWDTPPPPSSIVSRPSPSIQPDAARRTLTAHGAGGIVPLIFGGPIPTGGLIIFGPVASGGYVYIDFLIGEGPLEAIADLSTGGRTFADITLAATTNYNIHLGTAGDTTDALIQEVEPDYEVPEFTARVSCKFPTPNGTTGDYTPLELKCTVAGLLCYDPRIPGVDTVATTNPILHLREALTNTRWGMGNTMPAAIDALYETAADDCDLDIGGGIKRWESSIKFDTDSPFRDALEVLRAQCAAIVVYDEGWKAFLDIARDATGFVFKDRATDTHDINCERMTVETAGVEEVQTVTVLDYTDDSDEFRDASIQWPRPAPAGEYREQRFVCRGITKKERANRMVQYIHKRSQLDKKIATKAIQSAFHVEPGDHVQAVSRRLTVSDPEEVSIVDINEEEDSWGVAMELYRASTYEWEPLEGDVEARVPYFADDLGNTYDLATGDFIAAGAAPETADTDAAYGYSISGDDDKAGAAGSYADLVIGSQADDSGYQGPTDHTNRTTLALGIGASSAILCGLELKNSGGGGTDTDWTVVLRNLSDYSIITTNAASYITSWIATNTATYPGTEIDYQFHVSADPVDGSFWINVIAQADPPPRLAMWNIDPGDGSLIALVELDHQSQFIKRVEKRLGNYVDNPSFELGDNGDWAQTWTDWEVITNAAGHSGSWFAELRGKGNPNTDTLTQSIALPPATTVATLSFWYRIWTADAGPGADDSFTLKINADTIASYSNLTDGADNVWHYVSYDISAYAGTTFTLTFTGTEDADADATGMDIDDVRVTAY